jgi:hypothetical protein
METRSPSQIAIEWIEKWSGPKVPAVGPGFGESVLDWQLPREQPELCLATIVEALSRIDGSKPSHLLSVLAAGPLESLLDNNADAVVDEVDLLARRDPAFRLLLNGVWDSGIKPHILERLAKYRVQPW